MMNETKMGAQALGVLAAGFCTAAFGGADAWLKALLVFMALDYLTGVTKAALTRSLSSAVGFKGLAKKMVLLTVVALAARLDGVLGAGGTVRSLVIGFYLANEGLSLLENAAACGVPVPQKLLGALEQLQTDTPAQQARDTQIEGGRNGDFHQGL